MQKLRIDQIIKLIESNQTFEAISSDNSFAIKINRYLPFFCTAIHDGSKLRPNLKKSLLLDEFDLWYEEDPHTGSFINSLPITLIGLDSRFEYDLNRSPENCIYEEAWGKKVWKDKMSPKEIQISKKKHENYYKVTHALVKKLNELFDSCIVYDIHSYNWQRWDRSVPLFNIGIERIDSNKFGSAIENWRTELSSIELSGVENTTEINSVFYGRGYNLEFITSNFPNVLVLATEIKKVYCNEITGQDYPEVIKEIQQKLKTAILKNAQFYSQNYTNWKSKKVGQLMDKKHDESIFKADALLFKLLNKFELLANVNPINTGSQQKKFLNSKFTKLPKFRYSPIKINPFELKQKLSAVPTRDIADISIRNLYESLINSYFDKIDLLSSLDTEKFLYNSLRYFGRPSKKDLVNANYLLHLPSIPSEPEKMPFLPIETVIQEFRNALIDYEIDCKIELSSKVISQVMVLNSKKTILFRPDAKFTIKDTKALIEHEIGVHMVTTQNSSLQKLKLFNLGLPVNTETQEGMAILSEYLSGNISLKRLKKIALRVVITDMMCSGADFIECFKYLVSNHEISNNDAFTLVTRIFRGGGFTKDYLYLSGFVKILKLWNSNTDLSPLLIGKTSIAYFNTINEMLEREIVVKPRYITKSFINPKLAENNQIYDYIISGLK